MKKKILCMLMLSAMLLSSCSTTTVTDTTTADNEQTAEDEGSADTAQAVDETVTEEVEEDTPDIPDDLSFDGADFCFGVVDNANGRNAIVMEEMTGEVLNDAQYETIQSTEDRLNVNITENCITTGYPAAGALTPFITAGDDVIQVANVFCVDVVTLMNAASIQDYSKLSYINLDKSYWDSSINANLVFGTMRYAAIGDLSVATSDLTFCLLFNDYLIENYNLESPYDLVFEGKWTMDKMSEMMQAVLTDVDGDGEWTDSDTYGYLSHPKNTLPSFWVATGEQTVKLDENGALSLNMSGERFYNVFTKIFEITYDTGVRYTVQNEDNDVPSETIRMFSQDQSLFMDNTFYWITELRDMEHDFGIIPYPKYDENQENYYTRVSYYMPPVVPVTNTNGELTGAVLEVANYYAGKLIRPAYYETTLKGKFARDEESIQMLDLMWANRVIDLGDSLFCSNIRDGFVCTLYRNNDRDLASAVKKNEKILNKTFEKITTKADEIMNGSQEG